MSLLTDVLLGVQTPQILLEPADVHSHVEAEEAIELAEAFGMRPDEHQRTCLFAGMGTRRDGTWSASQVADAESRQNGKGDKIQIRELHGMVNRGEPIIHTAHEYPTAARAFARMLPLFTEWDDLRRLVKKIRYANGEQGIELLNGGSVHYRARTGGGARGFDDIGTIVYDEAQHLEGEHLAASSPTGAVHPNPQTWFAGSAGLPKSVKWWEIRKRALVAIARREAGLPSVDPRFAYVEHTAEVVSLDEKGRVQSVAPDPLDRRAWALANPAYNVRISDEFLVSQYGLLGPALFLREHCGVWDPVPDDEERAVKLPASEWAATGLTPAKARARTSSLKPGEVTIAFAVSVDGTWSSIGLGAGSLADPFVEQIEHRQGVGWLPARLVELVEKWQPLAWGCDSGGPSGAQVGAVLAHFAAEKVSTDKFVPLSMGDYKHACGGFFTDVVEGRLKRPAEGQGPLDLAAGDACERRLGDAWAWDRRNVRVPICPLEAVTIARSLLPTSREAFYVY